MGADAGRGKTGEATEQYAQARVAWHHALEQYLRLARAEASAARLRVAAATVHAAALRKGRLAPEDHDECSS